jgi:hypothetical protein
MAYQAKYSMLRAYFGHDPLATESTDRKMKQMGLDLAGPNPTQLEAMLVERILLCWLSLYYAESLYAQNQKELSLSSHEFQQKRIDRCHKRYLSAIKTLAMVRKLQIPNVQVNVGEKQVNIGTVNGVPQAG